MLKARSKSYYANLNRKNRVIGLRSILKRRYYVIWSGYKYKMSYEYKNKRYNNDYADSLYETPRDDDAIVFWYKHCNKLIDNKYTLLYLVFVYFTSVLHRLVAYTLRRFLPERYEVVYFVNMQHAFISLSPVAIPVIISRINGLVVSIFGSLILEINDDKMRAAKVWFKGFKISYTMNLQYSSNDRYVLKNLCAEKMPEKCTGKG